MVPVLPDNFANHTDGIGDGHSDLDDRDSAGANRFNGAPGMLYARRTHYGNNPGLADPAGRLRDAQIGVCHVQ
jgi:hypothetical protein